MTTGRGIAVCSECSSHAACSSTSAFSLSSRTAARRTVQTLIGSYVALRTSTRPASRPRRWCSEPARTPLGLVVSSLPMAAFCAGSVADRGGHGRARSGRRIACPAAAPPRSARRSARDRVGDRRLVGRGPPGRRRTCSGPSRAARGPRLDLASGSRRGRRTPTGSARASPAARRRRPRRPPTSSRRPSPSAAPAALPGAAEPDEARLVVGLVLDALAQHPAAVELGGERAGRAPPTARRRAATSRTASAVEVAASTVGAAAARSRRKRAHWPSACGCETTASIASSSIALAGDQAVADRRARSRRRSRRRAPRSASASSVALTAPSSEFSIGTSARSTAPRVDRHDRLVDRRRTARARPRASPAAPRAPPPR